VSTDDQPYLGGVTTRATSIKRHPQGEHVTFQTCSVPMSVQIGTTAYISMEAQLPAGTFSAPVRTPTGAGMVW
jgi:hypothetical protein